LAADERRSTPIIESNRLIADTPHQSRGISHAAPVTLYQSRFTRNMARVPLLDERAGPDVAAVVAKIRGKRGGRLLNLYRALLHAPELASAWIDFNNAVRYQTGLGDRVRELIIMRVAALNMSSRSTRRATRSRPASRVPRSKPYATGASPDNLARRNARCSLTWTR
jgi:hypothetical protein